MQNARCVFALIAAAPFGLMAQGLPDAQGKLLLRQGWNVESSAHVGTTGEQISTPGFRARGWYRAALPSTVLSALVRDNVYPDPYFGMNLRQISGTAYPVGMNFSNIAMPPDSPFRASWWYRTDFKAPEDYWGKTVWLHFDGINYRANVWLNGRQIASADKMAGAWRLFEYDVTHAVRPGAANSLAVEVFPPGPDDLAITFVDWNPQPPDKNMGIWRDVYLTVSGPVAVRFPHVIARLNAPAYDHAELTVTAELRNASPHEVRGVLKGQIEGLRFSQPVTLAARESRVVSFTPEAFAVLKIANPKLWWPAQAGEPHLYALELSFEAGGAVTDRVTTRFGIREVTSRLDEQRHRLFQINGKNILIRGAGYTFDMLLRSSPERHDAELKYVLDMNLNAIRLEGKLEDDHFLDLCDRYGILVLAGWCCCDHWEKWQDWKDEDQPIAVESLRDQVRRLRNHPSVMNWMNGSDNPPAPDVEKAYIEVLNQYNWPNPYESSATAKPSPVTGETGVKMTGPYDYVAPAYWLLDRTRGGAHGFNTETSPGPSVPPVESIRRMLPSEHWWPIDSWWSFHAGGGMFREIKIFTEALNARYGSAKNLEDYALKAQMQAYEGHRAMFEAFGRNKYTSTGVVQWMLNNAWPSMIWHLYDWYLRPGGSYFGAKKACEPLHVQYSYDDASIVIVNSYYRDFPGMRVAAKVYNLDMTEKFSKDARVDVAPDSSTRVFSVPAIDGLSPTYFVWLMLDDAAGGRVSRNFYWLSTKPEDLDWQGSTWYHTPTRTFADYTALATLPAIDLKAASESEALGTDGTTRVTVENPTQNLAFFVRLKVNRPRDGEEILPVLWQDNYFSLLPGERRTITATYRTTDLHGTRPAVEIQGWNVKRKTL